MHKNNEDISLELINRISDGDSEALAELFNMYSKDVFKFSMSILMDYHTAEDVTQEVFMKILKSAGQKRKNFSVKSWILSITHNTSIDHIRKNKMDYYDYSGIVDSIPQEENQSLEFYELIASLNDNEKQIVTLYIANEMKHKEIAEILKITESAVRKRYSRALSKLKNNFSDIGVME